MDKPVTERVAEFHTEVERLRAAVGGVVVGLERPLELLLVALLCRGHALIEDVPGVGKTLLARTLAASLGVSFRRVQLTADVLPSDITGSSIFNQQRVDFEFRPGPIFTHVLLADEINRATPRAQSALLEAMEEGQVTVDGTTTALPQPFLVLATQNPVELEGTFPLPEAQLDRFLVRVTLGYPDLSDETTMLHRHERADVAAPAPVVDAGRLVAWQVLRGDIAVSEDLRAYCLGIVRATREDPDVLLGASPRAALALHRSVQARALLAGRSFVLPDDVKALAGPVLAHRLVLNPQARLRGLPVEEIVGRLVEAEPVPVEDDVPESPVHA